MTNPTQDQLVKLLERKRDRVQRQMNRRLQVRLWTYYAMALAVVVGTIVLGSWLQSASAATSCGVHKGEARTKVEQRLGAGHRVMRDPLTVGVRYPQCGELVVLYFRDSRAVAHIFR